MNSSVVREKYYNGCSKRRTPVIWRLSLNEQLKSLCLPSRHYDHCDVYYKKSIEHQFCEIRSSLFRLGIKLHVMFKGCADLKTYIRNALANNSAIRNTFKTVLENSNSIKKKRMDFFVVWLHKIISFVLQHQLMSRNIIYFHTLSAVYFYQNEQRKLDGQHILALWS